MARFNLQDEEGARVAFRRALDAREKVALPARASPKTRVFFERVREAWRAERLRPTVPPPPMLQPIREVTHREEKSIWRPAGIIGAAYLCDGRW